MPTGFCQGRSKKEPVERTIRQGCAGEFIVLRWGPFAAAVLEAETVAVHLQDMDMTCEPIQQSTGGPF
jgi:hypothetical protein